MKPRNFPARKLARQIAAYNRGDTHTPGKVYPNSCALLEEARKIRTKKRRANV